MFDYVRRLICRFHSSWFWLECLYLSNEFSWSDYYALWLLIIVYMHICSSARMTFNVQCVCSLSNRQTLFGLPFSCGCGSMWIVTTAIHHLWLQTRSLVFLSTVYISNICVQLSFFYFSDALFFLTQVLYLYRYVGLSVNLPSLLRTICCGFSILDNICLKVNLFRNRTLWAWYFLLHLLPTTVTWSDIFRRWEKE